MNNYCQDIKISGIYKIINKINGKYYIGRSDNILGTYGRWKEHINRLRNNNHENKYLQNAWNKYGESNFEFFIIEELPIEKLVEQEQKYLNEIRNNRRNICYNLSFSATGGGTLGYKHSKKTKLKISKKLKGRRSPMKGKKINIDDNKHLDQTNYTFKNIKSEEIFYGRRYDFCKKFSYCRGAINNLIQGKSKTSYGWILI